MTAKPDATQSHSERLVSVYENRPFEIDITLPKQAGSFPVVVFVHGFKTFKDWGPFNLIAEHFAQAGFAFVKINLSHNGTTLDEPAKLVDLEAFRRNNLSVELKDLSVTLDYLFDSERNKLSDQMDLRRVYLLGHSRGGAVALLKASHDDRISGLVTWAALSNFEAMWSWWERILWRMRGVFYEWDQWHEQHLPVDYQLAEDFYKNQAKYHLKDAVRAIEIPLMVVHAKDDEVVPPTMAEEIQSWHADCEGVVLPSGQHLLGMHHPYTDPELPEPCALAVQHSIEFLRGLTKR